MRKPPKPPRAVTGLYLRLRLLERFAWLTPEKIAQMDPGSLAVLEHYNRLRLAEEAGPSEE